MRVFKLLLHLIIFILTYCTNINLVVEVCIPEKKRLNAGTVPANKEYAAGTVPANKEYAAGTSQMFVGACWPCLWVLAF